MQVSSNGTPVSIPMRYGDYPKAHSDSYKVPPGKGGVNVPFPQKLFRMLESIDIFSPELSHIVSWQPHGRCFRVHDLGKFRKHVLRKYFNHTHYTSFRRQLNLWGFTRLTDKGPDRCAYYHEMFLRSKPVLSHVIIRTPSVNANKKQVSSKRKGEPEFYSMTPMPPSTTQTQQNEPDLESGIAIADGMAMDNRAQSIAMVCSDLSLAERRKHRGLLLEEAYECLQDPFSPLPFPKMIFAVTGVRSSARCETLEKGSIMDDQDPCQDDSSTKDPSSSPNDLNHSSALHPLERSWNKSETLSQGSIKSHRNT